MLVGNKEYAVTEIIDKETASKIASLTMFSFPITTGIVFLPAALSPKISPTSLNGDVMKTIIPSINAEYIVDDDVRMILSLLFLWISAIVGVKMVVEDPIIRLNIIAIEIESVLTINLSFRAILGIEYNIPSATNIDVIIIPLKFSVIIDKIIPNPLVKMIKTHACFFVTNPRGIGRFFPFILSRSASIKSLKTYMPTIIKNEIIGNSIIFEIMINRDGKLLPR